MALLPAQKTLLHELLELFEGGKFDWFDYNARSSGELTSVPLANQISFAVVITRLDAILIEIAADGREARIIKILNEYESVSLDTTRISIGGGGGASGARYDPAEKRAHLKDLLQLLLGLEIRRVDERFTESRSIPVRR